jgi:prepilin-type N-terminal cleavage/methylation domain-containing protein
VNNFLRKHNSLFKILYSIKGFTLVELLVVIAVLGFIGTAGIVIVGQSVNKGRDAERRNNLKQLRIALEAYFADFGSYPSTGGALWGESSAYGSKKTNYITGLTPKYIGKLPNDPISGKSNTLNSASCDATQTGYVYKSDGKDYKLIANCTPEQKLNNPQDELYDPNPTRKATSWAVYTSATVGTNW